MSMEVGKKIRAFPYDQIFLVFEYYLIRLASCVGCSKVLTLFGQGVNSHTDIQTFLLQAGIKAFQSFTSLVDFENANLSTLVSDSVFKYDFLTQESEFLAEVNMKLTDVKVIRKLSKSMKVEENRLVCLPLPRLFRVV